MGLLIWRWCKMEAQNMVVEFREDEEMWCQFLEAKRSQTQRKQRRGWDKLRHRHTRLMPCPALLSIYHALAFESLNRQIFSFSWNVVKLIFGHQNELCFPTECNQWCIPSLLSIFCVEQNLILPPMEIVCGLFCQPESAQVHSPPTSSRHSDHHLSWRIRHSRSTGNKSLKVDGRSIPHHCCFALAWPRGSGRSFRIQVYSHLYT